MPPQTDRPESDLTGRRFGRLTAIERVESDKSGRIRWKCLCDCGKETIVAATRLRNGKSVSCGCYQKEVVRAQNLTHGQTQQKPGERRIPKIYRTWANMKTRCNNPNTPYYSRYGGRGIKVCPEWADSFEAFYSWAMSHGYDDTKEIDRIDNDGGYTPENCRWVSRERNANNKRNNLIIEMDGVVHTAAEWAKITGISIKAIYTRHADGKPPEEILRK